jgi:septum formation protein
MSSSSQSPLFPLILGSQSPRRRDILAGFSLPFQQISSDFDEESIPFTGDPVDYCTKLAHGKAEALAARFPEAAVLTADTVVFLNGKIYNKPRDAEEAFQFLTELAGHWQTVYTAVHICHGGRSYSDCESTRLLFHPLTPQQIHIFHKHVYFLDKAGGYAIEGCGQIILEKIEGCYYNVLGLPINATRRLLARIGIDLWQHLRDIS